MVTTSTTAFRKSSRDVPLVLIVDDDLDNIMFVGYVLDILGIEHLFAEDGESALNLAINRIPDLILLDMVMPEINGMEVTRLLKHNPLTAGIPIIAVTGLTLPQHRFAIKQAGCDDYISKPLLIEELEAKIANCLSFSLI